MTQRGAVKSAMGNFLGRFTSRYMQWDGYWLFGFLPRSVGRVDWDLLGEPPWPVEPLGYAQALAITEFRDRIAAVDAADLVTDAWLTVQRQPATTVVEINGHRREADVVLLTARVRCANGRAFSRTAEIAVAPHDPSIELRSAHA